MSSRILSAFTRPAPVVRRSLQQRSPALTPVVTRSYAKAAPGQASNVSNPQASSAEAQNINKSASVGQTDRNDGDHASVANPVSHPEEGGLGATEETTESQDKMSHDPNEPASEKKRKTLEYGQNKPLDPADK